MEDADYLEFNKFHFSTAPSHKRFERVLLVLVVLTIAIMTLVRIAVVGVYSTAAAIIYGFLVVLVFFVILRLTTKPLTELVLRLQINSLKKDGKLPFGKNVRLAFEEDCFTESTEIAETRQKYETVEKTMEGQHAVYVYTGAMQALIIPHIAFESDEQKREFLSFINSKINK